VVYVLKPVGQSSFLVLMELVDSEILPPLGRLPLLYGQTNFPVPP